MNVRSQWRSRDISRFGGICLLDDDVLRIKGHIGVILDKGRTSTVGEEVKRIVAMVVEMATPIIPRAGVFHPVLVRRNYTGRIGNEEHTMGGGVFLEENVRGNRRRLEESDGRRQPRRLGRFSHDDGWARSGESVWLRHYRRICSNGRGRKRC